MGNKLKQMALVLIFSIGVITGQLLYLKHESNKTRTQPSQLPVATASFAMSMDGTNWIKITNNLCIAIVTNGTCIPIRLVQLREDSQLKIYSNEK